MVLTHELKDYVVYRDDRTGGVFQCHKWRWDAWMEVPQERRNLTVLVENVTMPEAYRLAGLTRED